MSYFPPGYFPDSGGGPPPVVDPQAWCTFDDVLLYLPASLDLKSRRIDSDACTELIHLATSLLASEIVRRYNPIPGMARRRVGPDATGRDAELRALMGQDVRDPAILPPSKARWTQWVTSGQMEIDAAVRELAARKVLAMLLDRSSTAPGSTTYDKERDSQDARVASILATHANRVDADGDGVVDWEVNAAGSVVVWLGGGATI